MGTCCTRYSLSEAQLDRTKRERAARHSDLATPSSPHLQDPRCLRYLPLGNVGFPVQDANAGTWHDYVVGGCCRVCTDCGELRNVPMVLLSRQIRRSAEEVGLHGRTWIDRCVGPSHCGREISMAEIMHLTTTCVYMHSMPLDCVDFAWGGLCYVVPLMCRYMLTIVIPLSCVSRSNGLNRFGT